LILIRGPGGSLPEGRKKKKKEAFSNKDRTADTRQDLLSLNKRSLGEGRGYYDGRGRIPSGKLSVKARYTKKEKAVDIERGNWKVRTHTKQNYLAWLLREKKEWVGGEEWALADGKGKSKIGLSFQASVSFERGQLALRHEGRGNRVETKKKS